MLLFLSVALANTPVGNQVRPEPAAGANGFPTDGTISAFFTSDVGTDPATTTLSVSGGAGKIAGALTRSDTVEMGCARGALLRFTPDTALLAGDVLSVAWADGDGNPVGGGDYTLTVGKGAMGAAPAEAPVLTLETAQAHVAGESTTGCDGKAWWTARFTTTLPFDDPQNLAWARVDAREQGGTWTSRAWWSRAQLDVGVEATVAAPSERCFQVVMVDGLGRESPPSDEYCVVWAPVPDTGSTDSGGQDSVPAAGDDTAAPPKTTDTGCACTSTGTPPGAAAGLVLVVGAVMGARRRRAN